MVQSIDIEVLLAGAYAVLLILIALSLELVARYSHVRSEQMLLAGFRYLREHDIWECPTGQHLRPVAPDYARRSVRYRASAHACNACSIKHLCTDSDKGREIKHNPDSWRQSQVARFHRGISLTLLLLAGLLLLVEMVRHERPIEVLVLSGVLAPIILVGIQLASAFFASRTGSHSD